VKSELAVCNALTTSMLVGMVVFIAETRGAGAFVCLGIMASMLVSWSLGYSQGKL
jgi:hypothetical protein